MPSVEARIRDYLAADLAFLSGELRPVQREYHLPNAHGTRGYIDILATDTHGHYVIIEIKRSDVAAREAIHEVHKYIGLLRHQLRVSPSEIRVMIVSTEWDELLVPFSEFVQQLRQHLEGYRITLDEVGRPIAKEHVEPVPVPKMREFSRAQGILLYTSAERADPREADLRRVMHAVGLRDFVVVRLHTTRPIPYPHAIYVAFQRDTLEGYRHLLQQYPDRLKALAEYESDDELDADDLLRLHEETLLGLVIGQLAMDTFEVGYPEKFDWLRSTWTIDRLIRGGFFAEDRRLTDAALVAELAGLRGPSQVKYTNIASSRFPLRLGDIARDSLRCLTVNEVWRDHIRHILAWARGHGGEFGVAVHIFNPERILQSLHDTTRHGLSAAMPAYAIQLDFAEYTQVHLGTIVWDGTCPVLGDLLAAVFDDPFDYFSAMTLGTISDYDRDLMARLGLRYTSDLLIIRGEQVEAYLDTVLPGESMAQGDRPYAHSLGDFVARCRGFMRDLEEYYAQNTFEM